MPKIGSTIKKEVTASIAHIRQAVHNAKPITENYMEPEKYSDEYLKRTKGLNQLRQDILGNPEVGKGVDIGKALTLIEMSGLKNIEYILTKVKDANIEGDFVETGVWKGGAVIFAKAVMNTLGLNGKLYACDSYKGLPPPDPKYKADERDMHHTREFLKISKQIVENNFKRFGLLDDNVIFVEGWFEDTMPILKNTIEKISVLRLDGDMYGSTIVVLENLYDLVVDGGYVIIDDYSLVGARQATDDFRKSRNIQSQLIRVDNTIYYWRKDAGL